MKTKTRKLIGTILVWGGLGVLGVITAINYNLNNGWTGLGLTQSQWSIIVIVSLLIGGLWGMRK